MSTGLRDAIEAAIGVAPGSASWSDQQWHEHDAKIAELRLEEVKASAAAADRDLIAAMIHEGWPRRAIEIAQRADESHRAIVGLRGLDLSERNIRIVAGRPGCGKTVGCAWWAIRRGGARFVRASTFAAASRYDREERNLWLKAPALVLDDAGAEYSDVKGSLMVDLDELIDTFYGDRRPLLITTNCSIEEFRKRYGDRISDRLRECARWISVDGSSLRTKA
ncbi:MAG: ATP-binding protein [Polyangiaceae bacterium]